MRIAVIGGGAAGFFAAITAASHGNISVQILEKSGKVLSKVRISGGGRCNVTHNCFDEKLLPEFYPRGSKELRNAFARFNVKNTVEWFESRGVKLKSEADGRMFPVTDDSSTIINCLLSEAKRHNVALKLHYAVSEIKSNSDGTFTIRSQQDTDIVCDKVIVTTGGNSSLYAYHFLDSTKHAIIPPVPSLFTFNIPGSPLKGLEGVSVNDATVSLSGFKHTETGPVLITHWGISGPAVIRLSAWAARELYERNYDTEITVSWVSGQNMESMHSVFSRMKKSDASRKVIALCPFSLPQRLWERLCEYATINRNENYGDLSREKVHQLSAALTSFKLHQKGKTTYKEEFVTCGGISLKEVYMHSMQSKLVKGLFFAGEVLNIDGITGGFNFQAAWTTAWIAGMSCIST